MERHSRNAHELKDIVRERLQTIEDLKQNQSTLDVPLPYPHTADQEGCNWNIDVFGMPGRLLDAIANIVQQVRDEFLPIGQHIHPQRS